MDDIFQVTRQVSRGIGRGLSISLIKAWQFVRWAGSGTGRGLLVLLTRAWQFTCWACRKIGRGFRFSLTKAWQITRWASPIIGRGLLIFLSRSWMVFWWTVRELLTLLFKMVNGPIRALTVFVILAGLMYFWGVDQGLLSFWAIGQKSQKNFIAGAGIAASLVDLFLSYKWITRKSSTKTILPEPVRTEPVYQQEQPQFNQDEQPKPLMTFPRKRIYSDFERAQALVLLHEYESTSSVSHQMDIPQSTLQGWRRRYQRDDDFRLRIDTVIWVLSRLKTGHYDNQRRIEMNHKH